MDGVNSSAMRKKGVNYKVNFGVPLVTLRKISKEYAPDPKLADALWKEDTRELKILASLIQEPSTFTQADAWVEDISNLELAEQTSMNLFCRIPNAGEYAACWIQSDRFYTQITGFLLYARLFSNDFSLEGEELKNYFHIVFNALDNQSLLLKNAALTSLKKLGRQSVLLSKEILALCHSTTTLSQENKRAIGEDLQFEFDYYA